MLLSNQVIITPGHADDRTGAWEGSNPTRKSGKDEEILREAGEKRLKM